MSIVQTEAILVQSLTVRLIKEDTKPHMIENHLPDIQFHSHTQTPAFIDHI